MMNKKWAVFLSGRGSNLNAILNCRNELNLARVISDQPDSLGVLRSLRRKIPVFRLGKPIDWNDLFLHVTKSCVDGLMLLGFMRLIPSSFLQSWKRDITNLHPSLLPDFPGLDAIRKSHAVGKRMGISVHGVISAVDSGKIYSQRVSHNQSSTLSLRDCEILIAKEEQMSVRRWMTREGRYA